MTFKEQVLQEHPSAICVAQDMADSATLDIHTAYFVFTDQSRGKCLSHGDSEQESWENAVKFKPYVK